MRADESDNQGLNQGFPDSTLFCCWAPWGNQGEGSGAEETGKGLLGEADKRGGHPPGLGLREDILVDLHHEVATSCKLGHEAGMAGGLEAGKEGEQEGVPRAAHGLQDAFLAIQAVMGGGGVWREGRPLLTEPWPSGASKCQVIE